MRRRCSVPSVTGSEIASSDCGLLPLKPLTCQSSSRSPAGHHLHCTISRPVTPSTATHPPTRTSSTKRGRSICCVTIPHGKYRFLEHPAVRLACLTRVPQLQVGVVGLVRLGPVQVHMGAMFLTTASSTSVRDCARRHRDNSAQLGPIASFQRPLCAHPQTIVNSELSLTAVLCACICPR